MSGVLLNQLQQNISTWELLSILFNDEINKSLNSTQEERLKRLASANPIPEKRTVTTTAYIRNSDVVAEVLFNANGKCDDCSSSAPFNKKSDGSPYLEVHHIIPLSMGGHDTVENSKALCPNCHRKIHYG